MFEDYSLVLSIIAVAVSVLSAFYAYRESKEATNMRKIVQADQIEELIEVFEETLELVRSHYSRSELLESAQSCEKRIRKCEIMLGKQMFALVESLSDPLHSAVDARIGFLESSGSQEDEGAFAQQLSDFEAKVADVRQRLRKRLRVDAA